MNSFEQNTNIREKLAQIVGNLTHIVNGTQIIPAIEKDIILQNLREAYVAVQQYDPKAILSQPLENPAPDFTSEAIQLNPIEPEIQVENHKIVIEPEPVQPQVKQPKPEPVFAQPKTEPLQPEPVQPECAPQAPPTSKDEMFPFDEPEVKQPLAEKKIVVEPVKPEPVQPKPIPVEPEMEPKVVEQPQVEQPKAEPTVTPTPENHLFPFDTPRVEQPKAEPVQAKPETVFVQPKVERPVVEQPKPAQPQAEQPKRSLNDLLTQQHEDHSIGAQFQHAKVTDISKAMSLNDKFLFIKVLFNGESENFALAIQKLNQSATLEEAQNEIGLMKRYYNWDESSDAYIALCELVNRKFI